MVRAVRPIRFSHGTKLYDGFIIKRAINFSSTCGAIGEQLEATGNKERLYQGTCDCVRYDKRGL